ncbi:sensor histidine kinase [Stenotrophomonas maltophilia]|uniref:sensor histidine kinase n=1 Tax=Stenotrophomonas maltophilia TaxID=40324 RepID=UPI0021C685D0|nr:sensor histidine kinase [Stenotrophomonas maltophilia]MCU1082920.1 sensor histidine kinase [Stenotrophomonas maltophilia]
MEADTGVLEIADRIKDELSKEEPDRLLVAQLSHRLLDLDSARVRFTVDATHVQRLGRELVAKQETALAELVKNSFDADACLVLINITPPGKANAGEIEIIDDGVGMSLDDLRNGWMRLSTDSKVDKSQSPLYGRLRAGRKGIGRFAVERLGRRLVLTTGQEGNSVGYRISFHWDEQFTRGQELTFVTNSVEEYEKKPEEKGTTLRILDLRDSWTAASIRMAWKMLFQLQSPVLGQEVVGADGSAKDPGFQVFIDSMDARGAKTSLSLEAEFENLAIANVEAELQDDGTVTLTLDSTKLNHHEKETLNLPSLAGLGPVHLKAHYLIFNKSAMPGADVKSATNLARELGGIKLYRNGFRVSPYGDQGDDWLSLASESARRVVLVPANNHNFAGQVHVTSKGNPGLEETASREGLLEGPAYEKLVEFVHSSLIWFAKRVGSVRERKVLAGQKDFGQRKKDSLHSRVTEIANRLRQAKSQVESESAIDEILSVAIEYEQQVEGERAETLKYEAMLRVLASLGLSIAVFSHEVSASTASLEAAVDGLASLIDEAGEPLRSEARNELAQVKDGSGRIAELGGYLGNLTTQSESRKLRTLVVSTVCETFNSQFESYAAGRGVKLDVPKMNPLLRTCPMHRSEFDSILFNFFSNSMKAIKRARPAHPRILVDAFEEKRFIVLRFQDTGDGIKDMHKDRIFDAFFTTSGSDEEEGSGTGLGLRIVSDIAQSYGGSVTLADPDPEFTTAFEFRLLKFDPAKHTL